MENELLEAKVTINRQGNQLEDYNVKLMEQSQEIEDLKQHLKYTDIGLVSRAKQNRLSEKLI